ncbi:helix-turn-helix transcriptional regulator [uncultured Kiloniella sp.]|uniref:helix-turn-helix domain-containing protein n=1 Tax=uncultured Kiloniella sp. TaxID=1133091 RepID=UPI002604D839|nr:helix-turn-helix transcriptional regulator [uncultured Kiloniella sp.]
MSEETIASRISELIGKESVRSFSRKCGLSDGTVRGILSGHEPGMLKVIAIANATGTSVEWLATGKETSHDIDYPESPVGKASPEKPGLIDPKMLLDIFNRTQTAMDKHDVEFPPSTVLEISIATYNSSIDPDLAHLDEDDRYQSLEEIYAKAFSNHSK